MSDLVVELLTKEIGKSNARCLVDAGLLDGTRFHCRKPVTRFVVDLLANLSSLKVFQFHDIKPDLRTLGFLNEVLFKRRKDVTLRVYGYRDSWANIDFLNHLPELEKFDWDTAVFGSLEPLYRLRNLVHLGLGFTQPRPKISISFVEDFRDTLESLSLEGDFRDILATIPKLYRLNTVWFSSTKLDGFEFLSGLPIETLGNYGGRVGSFESLRNLKTLRRVWIKTNAKLENIDFVGDLPNLEVLELSYVAKITRFPRLEHLKKLKLISASECNRVTDISELMKLDGVSILASGKGLRGKHFITPDFRHSVAELMSES